MTELTKSELTPEQIAERDRRLNLCLRQYRHNYGDDGFVFAYESKMTRVLVNQLTEQVAYEERIADDMAASNDRLRAKIDAYDKVLESHIKLLLRLSAFDAPEARSLAAVLQLERAELKGESDE